MTVTFFSAFIFLILLIVKDGYCGRDFYNILGVSRKANDKQIKSAFRQLSLKYHPDKIDDLKITKEEAEAKYAEINMAYETLKDPKLRDIYDRQGEEGLKNLGGGGGGSGTTLEDILRRFTGQAPASQNQGGKKEGPTTVTYVDTDVKELYTGADVNVIIAHRGPCPKCSGTGARGAALTTCPKCNGQGFYMGQTQMAFGFLQSQKECEKCKGRGKIAANKCGKCKGEGTVLIEDRLTLEIERGSKGGEEIILPDMGDWGMSYETGKLIVKVRESPISPVMLYTGSSSSSEKRKHRSSLPSAPGQLENKLHAAVFSRNGNDLNVDYMISIREALIGVIANITHLDGHIVSVNRSGLCTPHGFITPIENEGMPRKDEVSYGVYGVMNVRFKVVFPESLTESQKALVDSLFPPGSEKTAFSEEESVQQQEKKEKEPKKNETDL